MNEAYEALLHLSGRGGENNLVWDRIIRSLEEGMEKAKAEEQDIVESQRKMKDLLFTHKTTLVG